MKITKNWIPARIDWDEFGYQTMLAANDEASAIELCRYKLHGYALRLQPKTENLNFRLEQARAKRDALHQFLYDRPIPVDAPSMLVHAIKAYITLTLALFMAGLSLVGNVISFLAFGWGIAGAVVAAILLTALPVGIGHLAYEKLLVRSNVLQIALVVVITLLGCAAFYEYGQSRRMAVQQATTKSATSWVL